jgi:hypothetical protein
MRDEVREGKGERECVFNSESMIIKNGEDIGGTCRMHGETINA